MSADGRAVNRSLIAPLGAAVVALALLAVLLWPAADRPAEAGVPPDVATVAVDLDPTGNTATHIGAGGDGIDAGDIQSTLDNVAVGSSVTFDVVVDAVPSPGIFGIGMEVRYDPTIIEVTAASITKQDDLLQFSGGGAADLRSHDVTPDTDGSFRMDSVDVGGIDETGPGRVLDVTVKCIATGASAITLTDNSTGGGSNAGILSAAGAFTIGGELEAAIGCGVVVPDPTPSPVPTPTPSPVPFDGIETVAVDLDQTGNTATNIGAGGDGIDPGDIQSTVENVPIGSTVTFDIVVDAVPNPGIFGVGLEVNYDPAIVKVTAVTWFDGLLQFSSPAVFNFLSSDALPDTDGSFRVDSADHSGSDETGPGKVLDVTVECIAAGTTAITLTDAFTGGGVNAGILHSTASYTIGTELEASIECGDTDEDGVPDVSDNCPYWYNPAQVLPPWPIATDDPDCDGFSTTNEAFVGTDPSGQCAADDTANNEPLPDKWPTDSDDNQLTNVFDLVPYIPALNSVAPGPPYTARQDLNASGDISVFDLVPFISLLNKVCTP